VQYILCLSCGGAGGCRTVGSHLVKMVISEAQLVQLLQQQVAYVQMAQIISSQEAYIHLTHGMGSCGDGVVWTKRAAAKRGGAAGTTGRGWASIMNQDYLDELIDTLLLSLSEVLVREAVLFDSTQFLRESAKFKSVSRLVMLFSSRNQRLSLVSHDPYVHSSNKLYLTRRHLHDVRIKNW
jgi:hypothetical protein